MKLALWLAAQAASILIVTVFLHSHLTYKWQQETKGLRSLLLAWQHRAEHAEDQLLELKRRYALLRSMRGSEKGEE